MFYVFADDKLIFSELDRELTILNPSVTVEMGKSGSFEFDIPSMNIYYDSLKQFKTKVRVELDNTLIFYGRVLSIKRDFDNIKNIYCEGSLSYLMDSVQPSERFVGKTHDLFRMIIANHNSMVDSDKQFTVGRITVENRDIVISGESDEIQDLETGKFNYKQIAINASSGEWETTMDRIDSCLISNCGGYLRVRYENGLQYIDYLKDYWGTASQKIEFGQNLLDFSEDISPENVFTVLIPLGDENLTIASVNGGSIELVNEDAVKQYGRIVRSHLFDSVTNPSVLLENARRYMQTNGLMEKTIEIKAVDMHFVDKNVKEIALGDRVFVSSVHHDQYDYITCTKIEYDLSDPSSTTYTFGNPKQSLTERYRKNAKEQSEESKAAASRGGGGTTKKKDEEDEEQKEEFFKTWINWDPNEPGIDMGSMYKKMKDGIDILKNECGIDLNPDKEKANLNLYTMHQEMNENGEMIKAASTRIDQLSSDTEASFSFQAAYNANVSNALDAHSATIKATANALESEIAATADKFSVQAKKINLNASEIIEINGQIKELNAFKADIDNIIADKIKSSWAHVKNLSCENITVTNTLTSKYSHIGSVYISPAGGTGERTLKGYVTDWAKDAAKALGFLESGDLKWSNISGRPSSFPSKWSDITGKPNTFTPSSHNHGGSFSATTSTSEGHSHTVSGYVLVK